MGPFIFSEEYSRQSSRWTGPSARSWRGGVQSQRHCGRSSSPLSTCFKLNISMTSWCGKVVTAVGVSSVLAKRLAKPHALQAKGYFKQSNLTVTKLTDISSAQVAAHGFGRQTQLADVQNMQTWQEQQVNQSKSSSTSKASDVSKSSQENQARQVQQW